MTKEEERRIKAIELAMVYAEKRGLHLTALEITAIADQFLDFIKGKL